MHLLISETFKRTFFSDYNTLLKGGFSEPFYRASKGLDPAIICYREDYASSALHETAHWCVAGAERRMQDDFGYWYAPDGRTEEQQLEFQRVEVKPQALEWLFSMALCVDFRISVDNLLANHPPSEAFARSIVAQAHRFLNDGFPARAQLFIDNLLSESGRAALSAKEFRLEDLGFTNGVKC